MDNSLELNFVDSKSVLEIYSIPEFKGGEVRENVLNYLKGKIYKDRSKRDFTKVYIDTLKIISNGESVNI